MRLETALAQDVSVARTILSGKLGPVILEERDGAVWAQMDIGPALLLAAGADSDSIRGCGGPQPHLDANMDQVDMDYLSKCRVRARRLTSALQSVAIAKLPAQDR